MTDPLKPLSGVRVVDFTWAALGPYAGYLFASLGAEVIHVGRPQNKLAGSTTASIYHELNVGKINVGIDVKQTQGRDLIRDLAKRSDVFFENFRPGVVEKLGLGFADLVEVNPRLIMVSGSALGRAGIDGNFVGYAPIFTALSGLAHLTGYADGPPVEIRHPADLTAGAVAALAALAGLANRKKTGKGLYVDLSAREAILWTLSAEIAAAQCDPGVDRRIGNEGHDYAPHNVYRCSGSNEWISIAVTTEDEWRRFCSVIGRQDLADEAGFSVITSRIKNKPALDSIVESWTSQRSLEDCVTMLRTARIAASPSMTNKDIFEDRHIDARKTLQLDATGEKPSWSAGPPWIFAPANRDVLKTVNGSDAIDYVFTKLLKLTKQQLSMLQSNGIVG